MSDFWSDRYVKADGTVVAQAGGHEEPRFVRVRMYPLKSKVLEITECYLRGKLVGAEATSWDELEWADESVVEAVEELSRVDPSHLLQDEWNRITEQRQRTGRRSDYSFG